MFGKKIDATDEGPSQTGKCDTTTKRELFMSRQIVQNGVSLPYTCENRGYKTNIDKGNPHGSQSTACGNVFAGALFSSGEYSLWLEHVTEIATDNPYYWLMWYEDPNGTPAIPVSSVFDKTDLQKMISQLAGFVP